MSTNHGCQQQEIMSTNECLLWEVSTTANHDEAVNNMSIRVYVYTCLYVYMSIRVYTCICLYVSIRVYVNNNKSCQQIMSTTKCQQQQVMSTNHVKKSWWVQAGLSFFFLEDILMGFSRGQKRRGRRWVWLGCWHGTRMTRYTNDTVHEWHCTPSLHEYVLTPYTNVCTGTTGWRRCIGCLKLQVIFRKRSTNYRALLRKVTYEYNASYDSTPLSMTDNVSHKEWRRIIGCLIFIGHFLQKSPLTSGSFARNVLQLKKSHKSSPRCIACALKRFIGCLTL